jgi:hypothetical protein
MKAEVVLKKSSVKFWQKWSIALKLIPLIILVAVLKLLFHNYGFEIMELNGLFTSLVGGTIFLIGFLISGVLSDYKESEKIPSEVAASLKTLYDDNYTIYQGKKSETSVRFLEFQKDFVTSLKNWLYEGETCESLLKKVSMMNDYFADFEKEGVQAGYIIKMKNEQVSLRKMILRIDTIRETDFIGSAYAILEAMGFLTVTGLIAIKIEPFYASLFVTLLVAFLISYMFMLIKDLDNPFDYSSKGETGTEISLKPINDLDAVLQGSKF